MSAEEIAAAQATAEAMDTRIRHLTVRLDAATLAAEDIAALRDQVGALAHEMKSLRMLIGVVMDTQEQIDTPKPKAAAR